MKKCFLLLLIYVACNSMVINAGAQNVLIAKYAFLHVRDTTQPQNPYSEEMMLITNNNKAMYKSYTFHVFDSLMQSDINNSSNSVLKVPKVTSEQLFSNYISKEIISIRPLIEDTFGIKSPLQSISWQLIDSTKQIGTLTCKKATGEFKGRKYTCWYSPEIAIQGGPWKLHGLPGLIINVQDEKNQVSFTLISITQTNDKDIFLPQHLTYVTEKKFNEIKESYLANLNGLLGVTSGKDNVSIQKKGNGKAKSKLNNPLELN